MATRPDEKQSSVRINENHIALLDSLAREGSTNRHHLMISLIQVWLCALQKAERREVFHAAIALRDIESSFYGILKPDYSVYIIPEKPLPIKLTQADVLELEKFAMFSRTSRHQLIKDMLITGAEELKAITEGQEFQFGDIEPRLYKSLELIMKKGAKAIQAFMSTKK